MNDLPIPLDDTEELELPNPNKKHKRNRWWLIGGLLSVCLLIGARRYLLATNQAVPFFSQPAAPKATPTPSPTPEPGISILLMGRGGAGHDGGALADTIMLARILESQKRIVLLSLPRDLWVNIPYNGSEGVMGKINSSYAIGIDSKAYLDKDPKYTGPAGGGELAKTVVTAVTGIPIDHYVTIDFSGFEAAIDSIGGVTLSVDRAFTDYEYPIAGREDLDCTTYTPTASPSGVVSEADMISAGSLDINILPDLPKAHPCRYEALRFVSGSQMMNGTSALKYVRSRHSSEDGNDFSRSRRQKILLQAVAEKLFSINAITKIPNFFTTLRSHIDTDLTPAMLVGLLPKAQNYRVFAITSLTLSTENYLGQGYTSEGQFQLLPLTGIGSYAPIQAWIKHAIDPSAPTPNPIVEVSGNWKNSSASATLKDALNTAGYPTRLGKLTMKDSTTSATLTIQSQSVTKTALDAIRRLATIDDVHVVTKLATGSADIKIVLP